MAVFALIVAFAVVASGTEVNDEMSWLVEDSHGSTLMQTRAQSTLVDTSKTSRLTPTMPAANPKYNPCSACRGPNDETTCVYVEFMMSCAVQGGTLTKGCHDPETGGFPEHGKCKASTDLTQECTEAGECDISKGEICYWFGNHGACTKVTKVPETEELFEFDGFASSEWCSNAKIAGTNGPVPVDVLASQEHCAESCSVDENCEYFLYRDSAENIKDGESRYNCATFTSCDEPKSLTWAEGSTLFKKRSIKSCTPGMGSINLNPPQKYFDNSCCEDLWTQGLKEKESAIKQYMRTIYGGGDFKPNFFKKCDDCLVFLYTCERTVAQECPNQCPEQ